MTLRTILLALIHDRVIQAGTGTSTVSFAGAFGMAENRQALATLSGIQPWVAFFAALFGGLSAAAVFVYTCLRIRRMMQNPTAKE